MAGILKRLGGMPLEIDGVEDHVHTLTALPPTLAVSDVLEKLKTCSSKWVNDNKLLGRRRFAWQRGYGAFTVSASRVPTVRAYIRNQKRHHKTKDFKAEFLTMLRKNGIDFDERYIWD
jgi:REP element-mobilizing transposase RayT